MNLIKKFYDTAVAEAGGDIKVANNPAEAMAKFGSKSDENSRELDPVVIKGVEEKVEKVEDAPTATVEAPKTPEKTVSDTPQEVPKNEVKADDKAPIVPESPKVQTLDEVLKNQQPDTVLKALGFDDQKAEFVSQLKDIDPKVVGIIQAYNEGKLEDYVRELSKDYGKMSAEEVMRHQLRQDYPKASEAAIQALYEAEIVERYKLDPDVYSDDEVAKGKLLLEAKAERYRDEFQSKQEKYLMPKPQEPKKAAEPDNSAELQRQQIDAYRKELSENSYAKDIIATKKISFGEGEEKFSYPVDPNSLIDVLTDGQKWVDVMYDKEGQNYIPKVEHQLLVAAFAQDSKKFLAEYAKHLKAIGSKSVVEQIDNAKPPEGSTPAKSETAPQSMAEAMAKLGKRSNGGH